MPIMLGMADSQHHRKPGRPRGATGNVTRERIVLAAQTLWSGRQYRAVTYQAIADASALSRPAVKYYFPIKRDLYQLVLSRNTREFFVNVNNNEPQEKLAEELIAFMRRCRQEQLQQPSRADLLLRSVIDSQVDGVSSRGPIAATRTYIESVVNGLDCCDATGSRDTASVVDMLLAFMLGIAFHTRTKEQQEDNFEKVIVQLGRLLSSAPWLCCHR